MAQDDWRPPEEGMGGGPAAPGPESERGLSRADRPAPPPGAPPRPDAEPGSSPELDESGPPADGTPPAYGTPPAHGTPPDYGTPPAYGTQPPYGTPPAYGTPPTPGTSPGYGSTPPYAATPASYGASPDYDAAHSGYYGYGSPPARTSGFAIASFVLSLAWVFWLGSVLAVVFGHVALHEASRDPSVRGRGLAIAGLVIGYAALALFALGLLASLAVVPGP